LDSLHGYLSHAKPNVFPYFWSRASDAFRTATTVLTTMFLKQEIKTPILQLLSVVLSAPPMWAIAERPSEAVKLTP
jgi:hypothetical protein